MWCRTRYGCFLMGSGFLISPEESFKLDDPICSWPLFRDCYILCYCFFSALNCKLLRIWMRLWAQPKLEDLMIPVSRMNVRVWGYDKSHKLTRNSDLSTLPCIIARYRCSLMFIVTGSVRVKVERPACGCPADVLCSRHAISSFKEASCAGWG